MKGTRCRSRGGKFHRSFERFFDLPRRVFLYLALPTLLHVAWYRWLAPRCEVHRGTSRRALTHRCCGQTNVPSNRHNNMALCDSCFAFEFMSPRVALVCWGGLCEVICITLHWWCGPRCAQPSAWQYRGATPCFDSVRRFALVVSRFAELSGISPTIPLACIAEDGWIDFLVLKLFFASVVFALPHHHASPRLSDELGLGGNTPALLSSCPTHLHS